MKVEGGKKLLKSFDTNKPKVTIVTVTYNCENNNGIYYAMDKAIDIATGERVNFMNVGDGFVDNKVIENIFKQSYGNH